MEDVKPQGMVGITFGKVVAGAAIAVGAVLLAAAVFSHGSVGGLADKMGDKIGGLADKIGTFIQDIPTMLNSLFRGSEIPVRDAAGKLIATAHQPMNPAVTTSLLGGGLIGGGMILKSAMSDRAQDVKANNLLAQVEGDPTPGGYAERVQMAAVQSLMKGRMMAASPEFMQAMAGGQAIG